MLYPWMMDNYSSLKPFKGAAQILSEKRDWNKLYDEKMLRANEVPIAAAVIQVICMLIEIFPWNLQALYQRLKFGKLINSSIMD